MKPSHFQRLSESHDEDEGSGDGGKPFYRRPEEVVVSGRPGKGQFDIAEWAALARSLTRPLTAHYAQDGRTRPRRVIARTGEKACQSGKAL